MQEIQKKFKKNTFYIIFGRKIKKRRKRKLWMRHETKRGMNMFDYVSCIF